MSPAQEPIRFAGTPQMVSSLRFQDTNAFLSLFLPLDSSVHSVVFSSISHKSAKFLIQAKERPFELKTQPAIPQTEAKMESNSLRTLRESSVLTALVH